MPSVPPAAVPDPIVAELAKLHAQRNNGAGWLFAIAAFSVINLLVIHFDGGINFLIGLGVTQIIDGLSIVFAEQMEPRAALILRLIGGAATVAIAGLFVLLGVLGRRGYWAAFAIAMALYAVDGLIFLPMQAWLNFGFHLFALFMVLGGLRAQRELDRLSRQLAAVPVEEPMSDVPAEQA